MRLFQLGIALSSAFALAVSAASVAGKEADPQHDDTTSEVATAPATIGGAGEASGAVGCASVELPRPEGNAILGVGKDGTACDVNQEQAAFAFEMTASRPNISKFGEKLSLFGKPGRGPAEGIVDERANTRGVLVRAADQRLCLNYRISGRSLDHGGGDVNVRGMVVVHAAMNYSQEGVWLAWGETAPCVVAVYSQSRVTQVYLVEGGQVVPVEAYRDIAAGRGHNSPAGRGIAMMGVAYRLATSACDALAASEDEERRRCLVEHKNRERQQFIEARQIALVQIAMDNAARQANANAALALRQGFEVVPCAPSRASFFVPRIPVENYPAGGRVPYSNVNAVMPPLGTSR